MERIGTGQFALAILISIICGILLFIPSYRKTFNPEISFLKVWNKLPFEIYLAITIAFGMIIYFVLPWLKNVFYKIRNL